MPVAERLLSAAELGAPEQRHPLELAFCEACALVQLTGSVDPHQMFNAHHESAPLPPHAERRLRLDVESLIETRSMNGASQVVEIGSNAGRLLKLYADNAIPTLGIEPAAGPAATARKSGIETVEAVFGEELAHTLAEDGRKADIIHAAHVLDHAADIDGFAAGLATLLKEGGIAFVEVAHIGAIVARGAFDAIRHGRIAYFSLIALDPILRRHELYINDASEPDRTGTLKLQVQRFDARKAGVRSILLAEEAAALSTRAAYEAFAEKALQTRDALSSTVADITAGAARIAAYGSSEEAATVLNSAGLGREAIAYVCDPNPGTHGRYIPGGHQPVVCPSQLVADRPEFTLIMPSMNAETVAKQEAGYREAGGRFIVPSAEPHVV